MIATTRARRRLRVAAAVMVAAVLVALAGCSSLGFYSQSVRGQLAILWKKRPVDAVLADAATDEGLRRQLRTVLDARAFATDSLGLPDNGSYKSYVGLDRPFAVWNVVAAPALSVDPVTWCFPVAGCVSYRGYFSERRARSFAERLRQRGYDVAVEGVAAYSTLGWFRDPVLSTFVRRPVTDLASLIFHELAHQRFYVKNDTELNESFATVVEREGLERYLRARGEEDELAPWLEHEQRQRQFADLVLDFRGRLAELYASDAGDQEKLRRKAEILEQLHLGYAGLRAGWGGWSGYDRWFERDLNNAHLASVGAYDRWVPALETLLERGGGDFGTFYREVEALGKLDPAQRQERLAELEGPSPDGAVER